MKSDTERKFNDELKQWMGRHLDDVQNLSTLLHKFKCAKDGYRRKVATCSTHDLSGNSTTKAAP